MVGRQIPKTRSSNGLWLFFLAAILLSVFKVLHFPVIDFVSETTHHRSDVGEQFDIERFLDAQKGQLHHYYETVYPNTPHVQRAIRAHQHPLDCRNARYLIHEPLHVYGLGAVYDVLAKVLAIAIASNRILVIKSVTHQWPHSEGCTVQGPHCFFQHETWCTPPSNVSPIDFSTDAKSIDMALTDAQVLQIRSRLPYLNYLRHEAILPHTWKRLAVPPPLATAVDDATWRQHTNKRVWNTQAMLYLTRLNRRMQAAVRPVAEFCTGNGESKGTLGVPLRGSDKCYEWGPRGEMRCLEPKTVRDHMLRVRFAQPWLYRAIVTSEDEALERRTSILLEKDWTVTRVSDTRPGTGKPNEQLNKTVPQYKFTEAALKVLVCQLTAGAHVLTPRSNYHTMIDLLAKVVPGRRMHYTYSMGDIRFRNR